MAVGYASAIAVSVLILAYAKPPQAGGAKTSVHPSSNVSVVETASGFSLYYGRNFKVLKNPFYNLTYLLLKEEDVQTSERDEVLNLQIFQEPLMNYSMDRPQLVVGFMELLGNLNKLLGVPSSYICSPCVLEFLSDGIIPVVDMTDANETLTFGAIFTSHPSSNVANNSVLFDCMHENGPLKRAEWIKFLAAFFDLEERANYVYSQIVNNYQCLNDSTKNRSPKPMVAWLTYNEGIWTFSNETYKLQLNLDAGGQNLNSSTLSMSFNISDQCDLCSFYDILSTLDIVIDETIAPDPFAYNLSDFSTSAKILDNVNTTNFPFLSNNSLWRYDKRLGNNLTLDWYEGAIPQPQVILGDLIEAFYPSGEYNTTYLRNIAMGEGVVQTSTLECGRSITTRLEPTIVSCSTSY